MLELPEAVTIVRQMQAELTGRRIDHALANASPHKFAFFNRPPETYAEILCGRTIAAAAGDGGSGMSLALDPGWSLRFHDMGGRILFHRDPATVPAKHQLLLAFDDGSALSATIALWGGIALLSQAELSDPKYGSGRISPLGPEFTCERFAGLLAAPDEAATKSVKYFMISQPGLAGVGNGCLQDILFRAKIHPRRRVADLAPAEQQALYEATRQTLALMIEGGGRDAERDLYNRPGGYPVILGSHAAGRPCPACGTPIAKISYLGGASYFCPSCQD